MQHYARESVFNDARKSGKKSAELSVQRTISSAFGKFIAFKTKRRKVEKSYFNFQHQSLNGINLSPPSSTLQPTSLFNEHTPTTVNVSGLMKFIFIIYFPPGLRHESSWIGAKRMEEKLCITTRWKLLFLLSWMKKKRRMWITAEYVRIMHFCWACNDVFSTQQTAKLL